MEETPQLKVRTKPSLATKLVAPYLIIATALFGSIPSALDLGRGEAQVVGSIALGLAGAILSGALINWLHMLWFLRRAKVAEGVLDGFEKSAIRNPDYQDEQTGSLGYHDRAYQTTFDTGRYRFRDESGKEHLFVADVSGGQADEKGDSVRIYYLPSDPSVARRDRFFDLWRVQIIGGCVGLFCGIFGAIALVVG
jgi:hypothetical protein